MGTHDFSREWHEHQLGAVDDEIAKLSFICGIPLLDPGVVERVVAGDESVCTKPNAAAFRKLRGMISMHYTLAEDSIRVLGKDQTAEIFAAIRERLRDRFELGGKS
jgi:hypothetical protein